MGTAWTVGTELALRVHRGAHSRLQTARLTTEGRPALVLTWTTQDGSRVQGEASPLPGFGADSFDLAQAELARVSPRRLEQAFQSLQSSLILPRDLHGVSSDIRSPSARFAFEQCLLGALSQERSTPLWALLAAAMGRDLRSVPAALPASAVLDPLSPGCVEFAHTLWQEGVRTLKLKVGRDSERECLALAELAKMPFHFRLDPGQNWTPLELKLALQALDGATLEFVEDPTGRLEAWPEFAEDAPLALDEPLGMLPCDPEQLKASKVSFVVLKPMALGGFSACLAWAEVAASAQVRPIVSHFFDGPRALVAALHLAFALAEEGYAPGLGMHAGLEAWPEALNFPRAEFSRSTLEACASAR